MADITLQVNGLNYAGWQAVRVTLGMEQIAGEFELTVSERWAGQDTMWPIFPGDECRVLIGQTPVITGYVDDAAPEYDKASHSVRITGRDKTGDLVDCSAIHKSGEWHNVTLERIAVDVCRPFGIGVKVLSPVGDKFRKFAIQECETAFETLDRAARMRGILLMSDGQGNLLLTRSGSELSPVALVKGQNIEKLSGTFSNKDRHSIYIIKGQNPGGDDTTTAQHAQTKASCTDAAISRYRPLIVFAEPGSGSSFKDRAIWERNIRAGRGSRAVYTVTGWECGQGLWLPNRLVKVQDDFLHAPPELIIPKVVFHLDDNGSRTEIEVCRKEAFELINLPNVRRSSKSGGVNLTASGKDATIREKKTKGSSPW